MWRRASSEEQPKEAPAFSAEKQENGGSGLAKNGHRLLVISDTHGHYFDFPHLLRRVMPIDGVIHCGDVCGDEEELRETALDVAKVSCVIVRGNNDFSRELPAEQIFAFDGHRVLVTHGHWLEIYYSTDRVRAYAKEKGCDVVCCGHTHVARVERGEDGILVVNPGSLTLPRRVRDGSFAVLSTDRHGTIGASISYI